METPAPAAPASNANQMWIIVAVVAVGFCCLLTICSFVMLLLLGPAVSSVYSTLTPVP